jgi:hypothetical protein
MAEKDPLNYFFVVNVMFSLYLGPMPLKCMEGVKLYTFVISAPDGGEWPPSSSGYF